MLLRSPILTVMANASRIARGRHAGGEEAVLDDPVQLTIRVLLDFGCVEVRYAKGSRGSGPRRRTVLTSPEFDWVIGLLEFWVSAEGRARW